MTTITARCHPDLIDHLPVPLPAAECLPGWLRTSPSVVTSDQLGGEELRTVKHCMPFLDAMSTGIVLRLPCAIVAGDDGLSWDWDVPVPDDLGIPPSPLGFHLADQLTGSTLKPRPDQPAIKFINHWALETPPGCSLLLTHPFGREDLPFRTLTGLVDTDRFTLGHVHAPAVWTDPAWRGTLDRGTPFAQAVLVPRSHARPTVAVHAWTDTQADARADVLNVLRAAPGGYRKGYRAGAAPPAGASPEDGPGDNT